MYFLQKISMFVASNDWKRSPETVSPFLVDIKEQKLTEMNINPWVVSEASDSQEIGAKYMRDLYCN